MRDEPDNTNQGEAASPRSPNPNDLLSAWLESQRRINEILNPSFWRVLEQSSWLKAMSGAAVMRNEMTKPFGAYRLDLNRALGADFERTRRLLGTLSPELNASRQLRALHAARAFPALQQATLAHHRIVDLMKPLELTSRTQDIVGLSSALASVAEMFRTPALELSQDLGTIASSALGSWREYVNALPTALDTTDLVHVQAVGRSALGVAASSAILLGEDEAAEVAEKWELAPTDMREQMREALQELSPRLSARLDGAWDAVTHAGPDAVSQAANSAIELIDWTLRAACNDIDLEAWVADQSRPNDFRDQHGRPTRQAKIRYRLAERDLDAEFVAATARNLDALREQLQKLKHADRKHDVAAVARLLPAVEGVLYLIVSE